MLRRWVKRKSTAVSYDAIVTDWASRVVTNGGAAPSSATKAALSTFVTGLRTDSLLDLMKCVNALVPDNLTAALTPLIKVEGGRTPTEILSNGTFDGPYDGESYPFTTTGWTGTNADLIQTTGYQNNGLSVRNSGAAAGEARAAITTVAGRVYAVSFYFKKGSGASGTLKIGTTAGASDLYTSGAKTAANWTGYTGTFIATGTTTHVALVNGDTTSFNTSLWDTISIKESALCSDPWTNVNLVAGDLTATGLAGNAIGKYARTGLVLSSVVASVNNMGLSYYGATAAGGASFRCDVGARVTYGTTMIELGYANPNYNYSMCAAGRSVADDKSGYFSINRVATADLKVFWANSTNSHAQIGTTYAGADGTLPNIELYVLADNSAGAPSYYAARALSFFAMHTGLNATQSAALYTLVQALRTSLGGGYV